MKLNRFEGNPILSPNKKNKWESEVSTNPGAIYDEKTETFYLLYRSAGKDKKHTIYLNLATSKDGRHFKRAKGNPVFPPGTDWFDGGCVEDPRIVKMGNYFFMTYACRAYPPGPYWIPGKLNSYIPKDIGEDFPVLFKKNITSSALSATKDFKHFIRLGRLTDPTVDDRDVILFPEKIKGYYYLLHRPQTWTGKKYGTKNPAIWINRSTDLLNWDFSKSKILMKSKTDWEEKIGANTPPIKTKHGWFVIYHGVGVEDKKYRLGAILLDLYDPTKVLHRTPDWLLQPEEYYELEGYYKGVVFPCGAVVKNDTLFVYYGGADKYVGLATCKFSQLLNHLKSCPK